MRAPPPAFDRRRRGWIGFPAAAAFARVGGGSRRGTVSIDCYIIHHAANTDRRAYLESCDLRTYATMRFVSDWPPERIAQDTERPYRYDPERWNAAMAGIYRTFVGYAYAQQNGRTPWAFGIWHAGRKYRTLESAYAQAGWLRPRPLTTSEQSCYRNHLSAYARILASDAPFALVVEDDILVGDHSRGYLRRILRSLPEAWDVIDITGGVSMDPRGGQAVVNHFFYRVDPPRDRTTCGYLVSRRFCARLLELIGDPVLPIDWALTDAMTRAGAVVYWTYPTVFGHGSKVGRYAETVTRVVPEAP